MTSPIDYERLRGVSLTLPLFLMGLMLGGAAVWAAFQLTAADSNALEIPPGQRIIEQYSCTEGEIKQPFFGGVEDNFALGNPEPATQPEAGFYGTHYDDEQISIPREIAYDSILTDYTFTDKFTIPSNIASGLVVMGIRTDLGGHQSDSITVGSKHAMMKASLENHYPGGVSEGYVVSKRFIDAYDNFADFEVEPNILVFSLADMKRLSIDLTYSNKSVLNLIQNSEDETFDLWIRVNDDTPVDFISIAVCTIPENTGGLAFQTLAARIKSSQIPEGYSLLGCSLEGDCLNDIGHFDCTNQAPVACFKNENAPFPKAMTFADDKLEILAKAQWSRGSVKFTPPVIGGSFESIRDVDRFCRQEFGEPWRTLRMFDGGGGGVLAKARRLPTEQPVWIHAPGLPYGNCWTQE